MIWEDAFHLLSCTFLLIIEGGGVNSRDGLVIFALIHKKGGGRF